MCLYVCICITCVDVLVYLDTFHGQNKEFIKSSDRRVQVEVVTVDGCVDIHFRRQSELGDDVIE